MLNGLSHPGAQGSLLLNIPKLFLQDSLLEVSLFYKRKQFEYEVITPRASKDIFLNYNGFTAYGVLKTNKVFNS